MENWIFSTCKARKGSGLCTNKDEKLKHISDFRKHLYCWCQNWNCKWGRPTPWILRRPGSWHYLSVVLRWEKYVFFSTFTFEKNKKFPKKITLNRPVLFPLLDKKRKQDEGRFDQIRLFRRQDFRHAIAFQVFYRILNSNIMFSTQKSKHTLCRGHNNWSCHSKPYSAVVV